MEHVGAELERMKVERDNALVELQSMKLASETPNLRSNREADVTSDISILQQLPEAETNEEHTLKSLKSDYEKVNQMEGKLAEKEEVIEELNKELNSLKAEVDKRKEFEKNLSESNEKFRVEIAQLKEKMQEAHNEENSRLKNEVKRLENELRLQRERTATDEVMRLRNELRSAMEAEDNNKRAMDELALVIREVAAEANQAKEKLASAEEHIRILKEEAQNTTSIGTTRRGETCQTALDEAIKENEMLQNTIDRLRAEAEESLLAWNCKEMEFVKCIKEEETEKVKLQEENRRLAESFTSLEQTSNKLREDTKKLRDVLKESFDEAEMVKAEISQLKDCLVENERRLEIFTKENERLRVYEAACNDKNINQLKESEEDQQEKLAPSKKEKNPEEEQKKSAPSSSKKESKSHAEDKEQKWVLPSFPKKDTKSSTAAEEKDQKKTTTASSKKDQKTSHSAEEKKIRKDSSLDKEPKSANAHAIFSGVICFDPKAMLPIPGISSKYNKEVVDSNKDDDDGLTDSIFDIVESPRPHRSLQHRRTISSLDDEKSAILEELENAKTPHCDDMEVERAGTHSTKRSVLLRKFGDLWRRKNQGHGQNHNSHQKEVVEQSGSSH